MSHRDRLFSFAIVSDPHLSEVNGPDAFNMAMDAVREMDGMAFVWIMGDIMAGNKLLDFKQTLTSYNVPYHFCFGNQDAISIKQYQDAFGARYYSYEHEDCLFINLFNVYPSFENVHARHGDINDDQREWARLLLAEAANREVPYKKTFLFAHIPPLQPGSPMDPGYRMTVDCTDFIYQLCADYAIDACFYGHLHTNEVFEYDGTWHITTPSTCWNFNTAFGYRISDWVPVECGGYRIVHVHANEISDELRWVHRSFKPIG